MAKWLIVGVALFLVAAMYAACILAGRADDREERWFYEKAEHKHNE